MAISGSITSLGIGSGLDANSIVEKLIALERAPINALDLRQASYKAKISAFGTLKTKFDALKTASAVLADPAKLAGFTAKVGDEDVASASTGTFAGAGSYSFTVTQLAQAQKSFSNLYGGSDTFAAGTLNFNIGGTNVDVTFDGGSINDVRNAINSANIGVTATTVTGDAGTRLVLTAKETGTDNAFSLAVTGGDANLASLATFDAANVNARAALNAIVEIEGEVISTSQSNTIKDAIPEVTITAKALGTTTIDIARDSGNSLESVKTFITAFNDAVKELRTTSAYDASTKTGGPLNGDATVRTLQGLLHGAASQTPEALASATYQTLSALGIAFQKDGTLALDESKLKNAIETDFTSVSETLTAFGTKLSELSDQVTRFDGLLANRTDGLGATVSRLTAQRTTMEYHLSLSEKRLRAQFTALDALMGQLGTTSAFLTQQLSTLNANQQ